MEFIVTRHAERAGQLFAVREEVFIREQGVPLELEMDQRDPRCLHLLVLDGNRPVATGRLDPENQGKLGRVAVLPEYRGQGLGREIMRRLEGLARERGLPAVWCHAQVTALVFYQKLGYEEVGERFMEAGIAHCLMRKTVV